MSEYNHTKDAAAQERRQGNPRQPVSNTRASDSLIAPVAAAPIEDCLNKGPSMVEIARELDERNAHFRQVAERRHAELEASMKETLREEWKKNAAGALGATPGPGMDGYFKSFHDPLVPAQEKALADQQALMGAMSQLAYQVSQVPPLPPNAHELWLKGQGLVYNEQSRPDVYRGLDACNQVGAISGGYPDRYTPEQLRQQMEALCGVRSSTVFYVPAMFEPVGAPPTRTLSTIAAEYAHKRDVHHHMLSATVWNELHELRAAYEDLGGDVDDLPLPT